MDGGIIELINMFIDLKKRSYWCGYTDEDLMRYSLEKAIVGELDKRDIKVKTLKIAQFMTTDGIFIGQECF